MAYTNTWNAAFEALPPDTGENISQGANRIRALKNALRERLAKDHYMDVAGTDADHGEHSQLTFHGNVATPANIANKGTLYPQTANGKVEIWYKNSSNQVIQITSNGALNTPASPIPVNTIMIFYADAAPSGWVIKSTAEWNDITVMLSNGSGAGGNTGGANHPSGNWVISGLIHPHVHNVVIPADNNWGIAALSSNGRLAVTHTPPQDYFQMIGNRNIGSDAANTNSVTSGGTWRPKAKVFICCEKS